MTDVKSRIYKRGKQYYLDHFDRGIRKRISLDTSSLQVAREKQRQFDSARACGRDNPFPTQTPLADVVEAFIGHMRAKLTANSIDPNLAYLRKTFGPICPGLEQVRRSKAADRNHRQDLPRIETAYIEDITTKDISQVIQENVDRFGHKPKTANRQREVLQRFFNWAMEEGGVRMPGGVNPVAKVRRYREHAQPISFLDKQDIVEQLRALERDTLLQTMVAVYIYAGLRREEALWLQCHDVDFSKGPNGVLHVRAKTVNGESWMPKTKVNRVVPISRALRAYLDAYRPARCKGGWYFLRGAKI